MTDSQLFRFSTGSKKHELSNTENERSTKRPRIDYSNPHSMVASATGAALGTDSTSGSTGQSQCANKRGPGKNSVKAVAPSLADFPIAQCEMNLWDVKYRKDTRPLVRSYDRFSFQKISSYFFNFLAFSFHL